MSLTIDSEEENLFKFYSSSEAGLSPVLPTVFWGQVSIGNRKRIFSVTIKDKII